MSDVGTIEDKYRALAGRLDEAMLRLWAAVEAGTLGRGGVSTVAKATGLSRTTIYSGLKDLESPPPSSAPPAAVGAASARRIRAAGAGRKKLTDKDPTLLRDLDALVEPRGDPQSPLRWTCKSTPRLAKELGEQGPQISQRSVCDLLAHLATVSKRPARPGKAIRTGTPNSPISLARRRSTKRLVILCTADCGGSNGYRLWKRELQKLADELGIEIQVCHFPPGTSKWNTIEHRMFCHITNNWRGRPLVSREVVVNLIGCTTTEAGLHIRSQLDENTYETGLKVSDKELAELALERDEFHGEWNYRLRPREKLVAP